MVGWRGVAIGSPRHWGPDERRTGLRSSGMAIRETCEGARHTEQRSTLIASIAAGAKPFVEGAWASRTGSVRGSMRSFVRMSAPHATAAPRACVALPSTSSSRRAAPSALPRNNARLPGMMSSALRWCSVADLHAVALRWALTNDGRSQGNEYNAGLAFWPRPACGSVEQAIASAALGDESV